MSGKIEKFYEDLQRGNYGEKIVAEYLCQKFNWSIISRNNDIKYDFKLWTDDGIKTYEVKTDMYEVYKGITNNMVLETYCNGKVSGISATTADYFIYYYPLHQMIYQIKVDDLKKLMIERGDLFWYKEGVGDDGKVNAYIANRFVIGQYFTIYNINKITLKQIKKKMI